MTTAKLGMTSVGMPPSPKISRSGTASPGGPALPVVIVSSVVHDVVEVPCPRPSAATGRGSAGGDRDPGPVAGSGRHRDQIAREVVRGGAGDQDVGEGAGPERR